LVKALSETAQRSFGRSVLKLRVIAALHGFLLDFTRAGSPHTYICEFEVRDPLP